MKIKLPPQEILCNGGRITSNRLPSHCPVRFLGAGVIPHTVWRVLCERLRLSGREVDILRGVLDDHKESRLANELGIAKSTVHTHMERLYRKLGIHGRVQLLVVVFGEVAVILQKPALSNRIRLSAK